MNASARQQVMRLLALVFCGWSLLVLVVAYSGLGGRYGLYPDAPPDAIPEAPKVKAGGSRLDDFPAYAVISDRPLFNDSRRPIEAQAAAAPPPPVAAPLNAQLTSVIITEAGQWAIVRDLTSNKAYTVKAGQSLGGELAAWKLAELQPRGAVFEGPGGRSSLELRVFDGKGGEAPTPVAAPAASQAGVVQESPETAGRAETPEERAEQIRQRIEERRRQMREEAERAQAEQGK